MKTFFIVISSILAVINILPYARDVYLKKTKPRLVSWFNWSLLTGIATAASFSDGQYASAILTLLSTLETLSIALLALHYGTRDLGAFDLVCQLAAISGLVLWFVFNSPAIAIIASIGIDFIAGLPTVKHSWQKPGEETAITFFLGSLAAVFTLLAARGYKITAVAFPIYLIMVNLGITLIIVGRGWHTNSSIKKIGVN